MRWRNWKGRNSTNYNIIKMKLLPTLLLSVFCLSLHAQAIKNVRKKTVDGGKEEFFVLKEDPSVRHGAYTRTDSYGKLAEKGYYELGKRDSTWEEYSYGWLVASGMYKDDQKNGIWKKYSNNEVNSSVNYVNGELQPEETYYENGKPVQTYNLSTKKLTWADKTLTEILPRYIGGNSVMMQVINKNTKYPQLEKEKNIQGTVYISFDIDTAGVTSNFKVEKSVSPGLDKEALRVAGLMSGWLPAIRKGQPAKSNMTIPVKFVLY